MHLGLTLSALLALEDLTPASGLSRVINRQPALLAWQKLGRMGPGVTHKENLSSRRAQTSSQALGEELVQHSACCYPGRGSRVGVGGVVSLLTGSGAFDVTV